MWRFIVCVLGVVIYILAIPNHPRAIFFFTLWYAHAIINISLIFWMIKEEWK